MNLPLQIYDFIAVLFPGVLLMAIIEREAPWLPFWDNNMEVGTLALMLVVGYIVGQLLAQIARMIEAEPLTRWMLQFGRRKSRRKKALEGRMTKLNFTNEMSEAILSALSDFYGRPVHPNDPELFNLAFSPVQDKMTKRDVFLALANMMRSLAILGLLYAVYLVGEMLLGPLLGREFEYYSIHLLVLSLIGYYFFRKGYQQYEAFADKIPFLAFLAWYRQQKMKA
ncbi:hypothetical protein CIG75_10700 [Tumebacillus algifaecis]|uniref:Uncharacterized protein n=1 Tax=Tumebacillus algifaecis TaxID=1214604 RepID=A0A223D1E8_9BACL|nr:hypothetical protein [Tumebacillus algifaecis]ASS75412.1 hypothetical protein CIG75_10700 [Tumebacillus algifaecis]